MPIFAPGSGVGLPTFGYFLRTLNELGQTEAGVTEVRGPISTCCIIQPAWWKGILVTMYDRRDRRVKLYIGTESWEVEKPKL